MSDIVQKKNTPGEELTIKVKELEAKIAEFESEKVKSEERVERLQSINNSM